MNTPIPGFLYEKGDEIFFFVTLKKHPTDMLCLNVAQYLGMPLERETIMYLQKRLEYMNLEILPHTYSFDYKCGKFAKHYSVPRNGNYSIYIMNGDRLTWNMKHITYEKR